MVTTDELIGKEGIESIKLIKEHDDRLSGGSTFQVPVLDSVQVYEDVVLVCHLVINRVIKVIFVGIGKQIVIFNYVSKVFDVAISHTAGQED